MAREINRSCNINSKGNWASAAREHRVLSDVQGRRYLTYTNHRMSGTPLRFGGRLQSGQRYFSWLSCKSGLPAQPIQTSGDVQTSGPATLRYFVVVPAEPLRVVHHIIEKGDEAYPLTLFTVLPFYARATRTLTSSS